MAFPKPVPRLATAADRADVVRVLSRAFDADALANWFLRKDELRGRAFEIMWETFYDHLIAPCDGAWIASAPGEGPGGAALWVKPGKMDPGMLAGVAMGARLWRVVGVANAIEKLRAANEAHKRHPKAPPHWYLFSIGVDPAMQGRGIGSALLDVVLAQCDASGEPAYLEASSENNARLYARHGFVAREKLHVAPDAPPCWLMWRDPKPAP